MSDDWGNDPVVSRETPVKDDWGNDPVSGAPKFKFSDQAISQALKTPGSKTVMMSPDQYLALTPELQSNARTDKKGADLKKSLDNGDKVDEVPSLDVLVGTDGAAKVVDQDGRHRALYAKENGLGLIPVTIKGTSDKLPIKSLMGMQDKAEPVPFDFATVTPPPGLMSRVGTAIKNAVYVPPEKRQDATFGDAVVEGFKGVPEEILKQGTEGVSGVLDAYPNPFRDGLEKSAGDALNMVSNPMGYAMKIAGPAIEAALSPVTGALTSQFGRPIEQATGLKREVTGNVLSALVPLAGEAKVAGAVEDAAKAAGGKNALLAASAPDATHAAKVARLEAEGITPTIGQKAGGQIRRFEEAAKSDPLVGGAVRSHENRAIESFNTALYNRVLKPIGETVDSSVRIGRDGVKAVGDKVSAAYEALKPKMNLEPDDELVNGLVDVRKKVTELPPAQQQQFEAILNNRVLHRLGDDGKMDGETFKTVESEVSTLARSYKGSPDPAQRHMGDALEDVNGLLRDNLERTSPEGIREQLKKVNTSWALLTRLEDAAQARKAGGGLITPGDLLGSVRKMDRTVRHRTFARGDAMLQQFGEDASDVLGNKLPDSGTPERLNMNHHGILMYGAGHLTNPTASAGMNLLKRFSAHSPSTKNYLLRSTNFGRAPALAPLNMLPSPNQTNGQ